MPEISKDTANGVGKSHDPMSSQSDLRDKDRRICIVTTAALPWRTGTSVNPLARALYLTKGRPKNHVTILVPWLENLEEQSKIFGADTTFDSEEDQETWIRQYCKDRMHCEEEATSLQIKFYAAFYHDGFGSIFPTVDICSLVPEEEADIAILEEPEHLTWFRVPPESGEEAALLGWKFKFNYVVGILHTNYSSYIKQSGLATSLIGAPALSSLSSIVVRAYCHRLIRLSATLPELDSNREKTCNVHGVRSEFFEAAEDYDAAVTSPSPIYFIGKLVWAKGFDKLLDMETLFKERWGEYFPIDIYGAGKEEDSIKRAFFGRRGLIDMADDSADENVEVDESTVDNSAGQVFGATGSLRDQLVHNNESGEPSPQLSSSTQRMSEPDALNILGELSGKSIETGLTATAAIAEICKKAVDLGFHCTFSEDVEADSPSGEYRFDLPKSTYELRRHPISARFLGTLDHAVIKNIPSHKVFLNLSESEVLCTTTAEALAMGKWVVIPNHPSNQFFIEFPNCLSYSCKEECIEHIKYALENDPQPLAEKYSTMLSWDGANERLFTAALMAETEFVERKNSKDKDLARLHINSSKHWHAFQSAVVTNCRF